MSSSVFFVAGRIREDAEIDRDITEITMVIQAYRQQVAIQLQKIQQYMSPELAKLTMTLIKTFNSGIDAHQKRLFTLEKIKNNQMILQTELELLSMMPVFKKYEKYWNICPDEVPLSQIG